MTVKGLKLEPAIRLETDDLLMTNQLTTLRYSLRPRVRVHAVPIPRAEYGYTHRAASIPIMIECEVWCRAARATAR